MNNKLNIACNLETRVKHNKVCGIKNSFANSWNMVDNYVIMMVEEFGCRGISMMVTL